MLEHGGISWAIKFPVSVAGCLKFMLFADWTEPHKGWGCGSVGRASNHHAADAGLISLVRQGIFLPESAFSADSYHVHTPMRCCLFLCLSFLQLVLEGHLLLPAGRSEMSQAP